MITSIATVTLGSSLPSRLEAIAEAGFQAVELFDTDLEAFDGSAASIKQLLLDTGLRAASYFPLREIEGTPLAERQSTRDRSARYLDYAVQLGAPMVMMCSATGAQMSADREHILDDLENLADMAKERGLLIAYEAIAWGRYVYDYRQAAELVNQLKHPHFGLVLDSFHIFARDLPLSGIAQIPKEQIFLVQLSDAPKLDVSYLEWSRNHRTLPGRGVFDLASFTAQVRQSGFDGVVSLECFSDALRNEAVADVAAKGINAINNLWFELDPSGCESPTA